MSVFAWLVLHEKILTNMNRARRGLKADPSCGLCGAVRETKLHILRECPNSSHVEVS